MGNTPSHSGSGNNGGSGAASSPPTPASGGHIVIGGSSSTFRVGPSSSSSSNPTAIPTSSSSSSRNTVLPASSSATAFHSGLTPPPTPPSPPPPSTPLLLPHAGHLSPQNPHALSHPQAHDYSKSVVTHLILDNKLAPFYRGLEDWEDDFTEEDVGRILTELREKDYENGVMNSFTARLKDEREAGNSVSVGSVAKKMGMHRSREAKIQEEKEEREKRERRAYLGAVECPICFLNYPPNINTSRCCQQPLCTECFVQIKRGEATLTHLESEPACCPFCVETDFGVIYERPNIVPGPPSPSSGSGTSRSRTDGSALATSPEVASVSGFSQALSMESEDPDLIVEPGMAPKAQETARRKSVSSKAKEVVTIDAIRPDWESKLNAVKAAAARKAARRIVMRQVGDRLVPIGFTSARAPGTADFSMSIGQQNNGGNGHDDGNGNGGGSGSGRRSRRRESGRQRELEEAMIMEAMRLSLIDHEEHQRKIHDERRESHGGTPSPGNGTPNTTTPRHSISNLSASGSGAGTPTHYASYSYSSNNYSTSPETQTTKSSSTASKLLSKLSPGGRSRAGSRSSVTFAPSPMGPTGSSSAAGSSSTRISPTPTVPSTPTTGTTSAAAQVAAAAKASLGSALAPASATAQTSTQPTTSATTSARSQNFSTTVLGTSSPAVAQNTSTTATASAPSPTTTLAAPAPTPASAPISTAPHTTTTAIDTLSQSPPTGVSGPGLPRLSLDMPLLTPDVPRKSEENNRLAPVEGESSVESGSNGDYAALESDEE